MSWNYRVLKHIHNGPAPEVYYELHEVYYEEDNETPKAWTKQAVSVTGDSVEELREGLIRQLAATLKPVLEEVYLEEHGVLKLQELPEVPNGDTDDTGTEREQCVPERDAPAEEQRNTGGEP